MVKQVTTIPATIKPFTKAPIGGDKKRKVAAYARVSTDSDEQFTSYEAQVDYYTSYIKSRSDWQFVNVYTDEGITGTNTKRREGFKNMIADALDGKIDLIVTKSVSRFARNTVDSLTTIRKLKENGCECFFEKENIWTFDSKGELLITIMSSLAQEESRSISENCTWGQRKRFADGKVTVPFRRFLGYDRGPNGELVVNPEQAKTVKKIYSFFLQGMSPGKIARKLTQEGILSPGGSKKWNQNTVESILTNEKYKGDALLQKSFTTNFLTKKHKVNEGEIPQYYVEGDHEAIIDPEAWEEVQREMTERKKTSHYKGDKLFSGKVICGECGGYYGAVTWHAGSKYEAHHWQCRQKYRKKKTGCTTPHVSEDLLKETVLKATNLLIKNKDEIISNFRGIVDKIFNTKLLEAEVARCQSEVTMTANMIRDTVEINARVAQNQEEYEKRYASLVSSFEQQKKELAKAEKALTETTDKRGRTESCLRRLDEQQELLTEFDPLLFRTLVDHLTVYSKDDIHVTFKNGSEIKA